MTEPIQLPSSSCIRVLVADDRPLMIVGISATLAAETELVVVGETTDGADVRHLTQELEPDVLLVDLEICRPLKIETVAYIRQYCPAVKIVALTDGDTFLHDLVVAGVAGCILETESPKMIVQAIRTVVLGGTCFSQPVLKNSPRNHQLSQSRSGAPT